MALALFRNRERPTDQLPNQDQNGELLPRAGGSLPVRSPSPRNPIRAYARWQKRDLSARRYVYVWADGLQARMEPVADCMLVMIGATLEGK
jgi:hypothetical protein